MKKLELIPAIDLIDGQCVRLKQGLYESKTVYAKDPVEQAKIFADFGFRRLHLVDLDGAREGRVVNLHVLEGIKKHTNLTVDFGGGIRSSEDVRNVFQGAPTF